MKKILLSAVVFLTLSGISLAGSGEVKKAVDFRKAGMNKQATAILEKEINDNPTNAEAHFQLGIVLATQGNMNAADERFASAVGLKPDKYAVLIGTELKQIGSSSLKTGRFDRAQSLFDMATQYQPNLREKICTETYQLGNQAHEMSCANYYLLAGRFCSNYNREIGQRLIKVANSQTTIEAREIYLNHAKKFISLEQIETIPEASFGWKVRKTDLIADLQPGESTARTFVLKEGKATPWLIIPQDNYRLNMEQTGPIIIDDGQKKVINHPGELYNGGIVNGEIRRKYTALKGETKIVVEIKRNY